jgi:hypothetical protein
MNIQTQDSFDYFSLAFGSEEFCLLARRKVHCMQPACMSVRKVQGAPCCAPSITPNNDAGVTKIYLRDLSRDETFDLVLHPAP